MLTKEQIEKSFKKAVEIHKNHLAIDDVILPPWGKAKSYWLGILIHFSPNFVSKDDISDMVREYLNLSGDQQVRHLKRDGWNLEKKGRDKFAIIDPYKAHSGFAREKNRSIKTLMAGDFNALKEIWGHKCATCGAREDEPDVRYGDNIIKLQRGHKDPEKPLTLDNTIPQCENCNRTYKDDFTFDDKGRVRAIASEKPVERASLSVKKRVKKMLSKDKNI